LYVNSAIKRGENLDAQNGVNAPQGPSKNISWKSWKALKAVKERSQKKSTST
jgi:hypothetical protein